MLDCTRALKKYYRLLAKRPRSLEELSKKWQRLALLKLGCQENPIEVYSSEEDLEEDPEDEPEDYLEEPSSDDIELANEENQAQKEDSVIKDFPESREYFEMFGSKKRKRNVICSRPSRPRSCKKEEVFPLATKVAPKPVRLEYDEMEVESVPQRL